MAAFVVPGPAQAAHHLPGCNTARCDRSARIACKHHAACRARVHRKADAREWAGYRANPMPWCTWGPESGGSYTAKNPISTAAGKFQMLDQTFHAYGGPDYGGRSQTHDAAYAPPLLQERIARRVAYTGYGGTPPQGLGAWTNC